MMDASRIFDAFDTSLSDYSYDDDLPRAVSRDGLGGMSIVESSLRRDAGLLLFSSGIWIMTKEGIADIIFTSTINSVRLW